MENSRPWFLKSVEHILSHFFSDFLLDACTERQSTGSVFVKMGFLSLLFNWILEDIGGGGTPNVVCNYWTELHFVVWIKLHLFTYWTSQWLCYYNGGESGTNTNPFIILRRTSGYQNTGSGGKLSLRFGVFLSFTCWHYSPFIEEMQIERGKGKKHLLRNK